MNKNKILATIIALSACNIANAEENLWVYTKGTDTRPQGSFEAKLSDIMRMDKASGQYVFHDIRPEVEYGITDRLTIGGELMIFDHNYSVDDEIGPMNETQVADGRDGKFKKTQLAGYEVALKYNILSPYKDALGLSVGLAYERRTKYRLDGSDINQNSYVGTIFLQKNWLDDTLTLAGNFKTELERRKAGGYGERVLEEEFAIDFSAGISYRFKPKHFAGLELRHQADFLSPTTNGDRNDADFKESNWDLSDMQIGKNHQYGMYFGPTYHYAEKNWWMTVGALFQVAGEGSRNAYVDNAKNYDEHERIHLGFSYGYEF